MNYTAIFEFVESFFEPSEKRMTFFREMFTLKFPQSSLETQLKEYIALNDSQKCQIQDLHELISEYEEHIDKLHKELQTKELFDSGRIRPVYDFYLKSIIGKQSIPYKTLLKSFTYKFNVKFTSISDGTLLFFGAEGTGQHGAEIIIHNCKFRFYHAIFADSDITIETNKWYNIEVLATQTTFELYVNGVKNTKYTPTHHSKYVYGEDTYPCITFGANTPFSQSITNVSNFEIENFYLWNNI